MRPSVLRILESMTGTPAFVRNGRLDVLAINPLGRALYQTGTKHFRHPVVGFLDVAFDAMPLPAREDQHLTMTCYTAEPGSPSDDALKLLASWAATSSPDLDATAGEHAR